MSKKVIRRDKTCLNCYHVVEKLHCPNCGQENIEPRKTFHELFIHFIEDLTHYENSFWKTIRNLIFKPGSLTREYLSGRRMSYLAPFRLYIFISFVTFLILSLLPTKFDPFANVTVDGVPINQTENRAENDAFDLGYSSVAEIDSIQKSDPEYFGTFEYSMLRKMQMLSEKYTAKEFAFLFAESLRNNLPKLLFIYLPLFTFVLYLFESKKRWYYFDHGIFTLHYFSFLLLMLLIVQIVKSILNPLTHFTLIQIVSKLFTIAVYGYALYYFFPAHHRFYKSTRLVTIIKGSLMFAINMILLLIIFVGASIYILQKMH